MKENDNFPKPNEFKVLTMNNFGTSNLEPWCRLDIFEVKSRVASIFVSYNEFIMDGTTTNQIESPPKIGFASIPTRDENPRVSRVRKCVGKGIQIHTDDDKNVWCTRKGKNGCFIQGKFISEDVKTVNNELTQGVPFKILDHVKLNEFLSNIKTSDELSSSHVDSCKVVISFIKDPAKDEELPLWIELWILNCVKFLENLMEASTAKIENEVKNSRRKSEMYLNYNYNAPIEDVNNKMEQFSMNHRNDMLNPLASPMHSSNYDPLKQKLATKPQIASKSIQIPSTPNILPCTPLRNPKDAKNRKTGTTSLKPTSIISTISNAFFRSKTQDEVNFKKKSPSVYIQASKDTPSTADIISGKLIQKTERTSDQSKYSGMSYTQMIKESHRQT